MALSAKLLTHEGSSAYRQRKADQVVKSKFLFQITQ